MSDLGGGKMIGGIWDKKARMVEGERQAERERAFQRTRMAPAVSHERGRAPKMPPMTRRMGGKK